MAPHSSRLNEEHSDPLLSTSPSSAPTSSSSSTDVRSRVATSSSVVATDADIGTGKSPPPSSPTSLSSPPSLLSIPSDDVRTVLRYWCAFASASLDKIPSRRRGPAMALTALNVFGLMFAVRHVLTPPSSSGIDLGIGEGARGAEAAILTTPQDLYDACPFNPDLSSQSSAASLDTDQLEQMTPFDPGLFDGLTRIVTEAGRRGSCSVLDLAAGAGQLLSLLDWSGMLVRGVEYVGLDRYLDIEDAVGRSVLLRDGVAHIVPPLCWADPSRQFDLGRKFDVVLGVVGAGQFVRRGGEGSFLDNLVRSAGDVVVVAWNTANNGDVDVAAEMERRGMTFDRKVTERLRSAAGAAWVKKFVQVFRYQEGESKPVARP